MDDSRQYNVKFYQVISVILSMMVSLLPFYSQLSWWVPIIALLLAIWGALISCAKLNNPSRLLKVIAVLVSLVMLLLSITNWYSLQAFVSLLALTACLKFIELQGRRDYLLLVFLGCFISACQLLFSTSLLSFAYVLLCLLLFHLCLLQVFTLEPFKSTTKWRQLAKQSSIITKLLLQGVPLALVLFLVMPRIGSLWQIPLNSQVAKTGVSDSLSIGDIAKLNQDDSVAMRVTFRSNKKPDASELYWRGVTLADFDGRSWRRSKEQLMPLTTRKITKLADYRSSKQAQYDYQVMLEPNGQNWLYSLSTASAQNSRFRQLSDYSLTDGSVISSRLEYDLKAYPGYRDLTQLSDQQHAYFTALPSSQNPNTRQLAAQLLSRNPEPQHYIAAIMKYFNDDFVYTLAPGVVTEENTVDAFLFEQKRGYCEHFASSTAFLLRAAGIPARIAAGYQGGQWSSDSQYLLVTQAQAHAWVEAWLPNRGWVRLDPTSAVAPERIEQGITSLLPELIEQAGFRLKVKQTALIKQLSLQWDNVNYQWHRWVLGYDNQLQMSLVKKLLGGLDSWRILLFLMLAVAIVIVPIAIKSFWPVKEQDPTLRLLKKLEKKLRRIGVERAASETLNAYIQRAALHSNENRALLNAISKTSVSLVYQVETTNKQQRLKHLNKLINKLSF
jgi:transglutaminase-like putative cysteine protease